MAAVALSSTGMLVMAAFGLGVALGCRWASSESHRIDVAQRIAFNIGKYIDRSLCLGTELPFQRQ